MVFLSVSFGVFWHEVSVLDAWAGRSVLSAMSAVVAASFFLFLLFFWCLLSFAASQAFVFSGAKNQPRCYSTFSPDFSDASCIHTIEASRSTPGAFTTDLHNFDEGIEWNEIHARMHGSFDGL